MSQDSDVEKENGNQNKMWVNAYSLLVSTQDQQSTYVSSYDFSAVKPEAEPLSWKFWRKRRYIVVVMAFCGFFNVYSLRVNLSVGIVAMTENRTVHYENGTIGWVSDWQSYMYVLNYMFTNWFPKLWPLHSGTRLPMGFQRERPNFELIFLGLHYDTIPWRSIWRQNWR